MEAIALIFSKFSEELVAAQMAALCLTASLSVYWLLLRKKKKESAEWVPAALVRAYLDRVRNEERDIRFQLFGEESKLAASTAGASVTTLLTSPDPTLLRELDAMRAQLGASDARALEFDRLMNGMRAEKAALEQKLRDMPAATGGGDSSGLKKEVDELKARLQEYEVIEDDLANLKKFQKENEVLRQKIDALEKAPAPVAAAPAPAFSGGEHAAPAMTLVNGGASEAPAAVAAPVAESPAPSGEVNTNVLETINPFSEAPAAEAAAPAEKSAKQKEEELLSEFEKMLAS
ncbi:MAG: hypothetical protein EOP11_13740 [Proteobacteria bacterium]|nr:MAG: hypothetical protein EOP11_13740 [Pseudomonadota bacterium]